MNQVSNQLNRDQDQHKFNQVRQVAEDKDNQQHVNHNDGQKLIRQHNETDQNKDSQNLDIGSQEVTTSIQDELKKLSGAYQKVSSEREPKSTPENANANKVLGQYIESNGKVIFQSFCPQADSLNNLNLLSQISSSKQYQSNLENPVEKKENNSSNYKSMMTDSPLFYEKHRDSLDSKNSATLFESDKESSSRSNSRGSSSKRKFHIFSSPMNIKRIPNIYKTVKEEVGQTQMTENITTFKGLINRIKEEIDDEKHGDMYE